MARIVVECVGGPADGHRFPVGDNMIEVLSNPLDGDLVGTVLATGEYAPDEAPTPDGRLLFRWRPKPASS